VIDLLHQGVQRVIGVYVLETPDGPALLDCGPASTVETLRAGLEALGLELADLRHLLLTHIHLDHAGAAGVLAREVPRLEVHVSEVGAPHLADPARLERSARRLYGEAFDSLWGELAPVPRDRIRVVGARVAGYDCFPTPGHASHHVCYLGEDGTLYAGDAAGVRILPAEPVLPPTPPPDIDLELWARSLDAIEARDPARLALIHFGVVNEPAQHLAELRAGLAAWGERIAGGEGEPEFIEVSRRAIRERDGDPDAYERAVPLDQCYAGLRRWWERRTPAED
jgi:glyoxylase-like metal-dependent hydrolase (beta-lactamase superfamily II)